MTVAISYKTHSLEGPSRLVRKFTARGSLVIDDIATALVNHADCPPNYGFWLRQWDQKTLTDVGGGVWECEVPYGVGDVPIVSLGSLPGGSSGGTTGGGAGGSSPPSFSDADPLGREWSWDFSQGSRLRTRSIASHPGWRLATATEAVTLGVGPSPKRVDGNVHGAVIQYNPETGDVAGCEVPVCVQRMELQWKLPVVTMAYIKRIKSLCSPEPHVNSEAFLNHAAGEVKFIGAVISWSHANGFSVRYQFECGQNQTIPVPGLPDADVKAWQYLDVRYVPVRDPSNPTGPPIKEPERWVIHDVLPEADLNLLFS